MHSPARKMIPHGENIFLGVLEGFKSKFDDFKNAISELLQIIQSSFNFTNMQSIGEELGNGILTGLQLKMQEIMEWFSSEFLPTWFEEGIMPWFSFEKWHDELLINIPLAFQTTWEELLAWWNEEAMLVWWEEYVMPWFEIERWQLQFTNILTALKMVWQQIVITWNLLLDTWWKVNVLPRFTLQKWTTMLIPVKTAFNNTFREIVRIINERMEEAYHAVVNWCSRMISELESVMSMISSVSSTVSSMGSIGVSAGVNIGVKQYATGGFPPEDGWFRASKGEYFGQFDDGTSYIGTNKQIEYGVAVGVEEAAYRGMMRALQESGNASLLASIEENTRRAADREVVARIDPDRETVFALRSAERRYGFQFT